MEIKELNRKYFQKSTFFLYPLLKIPKTVIPVVTYLYWGDYSSAKSHPILICRFKPFTTDTERTTEVEYLIGHPLYIDYYELEDESIVYVFSLESMSSIVDLFLKGEYSKFTPPIKEKILTFYKPETSTRGYMKSYLYPQNYYETYSKFLNVSEDLLKETVELIDPPNIEKESLKLKVKDFKLDVTS
jgi:hypothetical protein